MSKGLETTLMWCGSIVIAVAVAVAFLFTTFQTSADANKTEQHFDTRLDKIESKIDSLIENK